jgi:hypothetical protein
MADNIKIVGQVLDTGIVNRYTLQDERLLVPILQQGTFGQKNDYIEYFVFDLGGTTLNSDYNYKSYKLPSNSAYSQSLLPNLEIDPIQDIENLGYESGEVTVRYNFFRKLVSEPFSNQLYIQQISSDRTELRINSTILSSDQLLAIVSGFAQKQAAVSYYYYVILNFGNNNQVIAVNALSEVGTDGQVSILFKLYEPLPLNLNVKDTFWVVEEVINPYIFDLNLDKLITPLPQPMLKGPNFAIDLQTKNVVPTPYSNYNQLITSLTGSQYQAVLNVLGNQQTNININYSVCSEFAHYSSVENRLQNFVFKIGEIESYQAEINTNTPLTASNISLSASVNRASSSINEIITTFDGFESYLYFTSSSLTSSIQTITLETGSYFEYNIAPWPKSNSSQPYILYPSSSTTVQNWYATASNVAAAYDIGNKDILLDVIPSYILEDTDNYGPYILFVNMIGQYFDNIWVYIDKLTDLWDNDNNLNKGISQDLVYDWLESFGVKVYNSQGDQSVLDYNVGGYSGSVAFNDNYSPSSSFLNNVPRKDLVLDSYKRIYHNLPYLFKGKGAHGGLQGLITVFGITGSILPIKEYGGNTDYQDLKGYNDNKITLGPTTITGSILSSVKRLETYTTSSRDVKSQDLHFIDVSFSPQTQIDAAVSASITAVSSSWVLDQYIGDPTAFALETYPSLSYQREYWFGQTFDQSFDYGGFIRLIQFFDNSLFKMVKDFTPARGNTWTGVSFKSPVLERPKVPQYKPIFVNAVDWEADLTGAAILPVYDPYYFYLAGDKESYYEGNISGSFIDTYTVFEENNRNPYLVNNTIGYVPPGFVSGNTDFILNTNSPAYENFFINSDFNILQNNVDESLTSAYRKLIIPVYSVDSLGRCFTSYSITGSVQLQDSYLPNPSYKNPRYDGVQMYSRLFNTWSVGDNSYGNSPVINYNVGKLGLFTEIVDNVYLPGRSNAVLKYLVDITGSFTELNKRNRNWVEVQNTFKSGDPLNISLFNSQKYSNQVQTNGNKLIYESGYSYFPVFYLYGNEASGSGSSWITQSVFNAPQGDSQNVLNRFFTLYTVNGSMVPSSTFTSSSFTGSKQEVWNMFNITGSSSSNGNYFDIGTGPGAGIAVTSSYYTIPEKGNYQFIYDFNLLVSASSSAATSKEVIGSMELWVSSSTAGTFTKLDTNAITASFQAQAYKAVIGNIPTGYYNVIAEQTGTSIIVYNAYTFNEYDFNNSTTPINSFVVAGDTTYNLYKYTGYQGNTYTPGSESLPLDEQNAYVLGYYFVKSTDNPDAWSNIKLYSSISSPSGNTSDSQTLNFKRTVNISSDNISANDKIVFRFFIDNDGNSGDPTQINNAALLSGGTLRAIATNNSLVTDGIGICFDQTQNAFYLNSVLSPFFGPAYFFNPLDSNVSSSYASLYATYGDILYPFVLQANDKIVIQAYNSIGPTNEYTVDSVQFNGSSSLAYIYVKEDIDGYYNVCDKYYKILFLKRIQDETNIIVNYQKVPGKTSYGFTIPSNISPLVIDNIDVITKNVNQQLIDVGVGVTI